MLTKPALDRPVERTKCVMIDSPAFGSLREYPRRNDPNVIAKKPRVSFRSFRLFLLLLGTVQNRSEVTNKG